MTIARGSAGRINLKVVIIIVSVVVVLGVGAVVVRHVRREYLAGLDLAAGNAAYERQDWAEARKHYLEYLGRRPEDVEVLGKYAEALLAGGAVEPKDIGRAIGAYRQLMNLAPDDEEVYRKLAALYTRTGNLSDLAYVADKRLEQAAGDPEASIWLARARLGQHKTPEARKILVSLIERLKKQSPKRDQYVEACTLLSVIELNPEVAAKPDPQEALTWLDNAVAYAPNSPDALLARAGLYRMSQPLGGRTREQMLQAAREDLQRAEQIKCSDPRATLLLSAEWMYHGELDRAATLLEGLRQVDKATVRKYFVDGDDWLIAWFRQWAEVSIRRGKAKEAASEAGEILSVLTKRQKQLAVLPQIVRLYVAGGQVDQARKCLDECTELRRVQQITADGDRHVFLQAMVTSAEGNAAETIRLLEPLSTQDRLPPSALARLAGAYNQAGRRQQTVQTLQKYVSHTSEDLRMWLLLAREQLLSGQWSEAAKAARQAEKLDPKDLGAKLTRIEAEIRLASGDPTANADSLRDLSRELAKLQAADPKQAQVWALAADIDLATGNLEAAERRLKKAIQNCSETLGLELGLAGVLVRLDRREEAFKVCSAACERHPRSRLTWLALADLYRAAGNLKEAQAVLKRSLQAVGPSDRTHLARALAVTELLQNDREAGRKRLEELAERDPRDVRTRSLLLRLPEVMSDTKLAERLLAEIGQVAGENSPLWRQHRVRLWLAGDQWRTQQVQIIKALDDWMTRDSNWSFPALALAGLHRRLGKADQAENICRRALLSNPAAVEVGEFLMEMLLTQNRRQDAAKLLESMAGSLRKESVIRFRAALAEGDLAGPIEELSLQAANDPRDVTARVRLARLVYQRSRDAKRAMQHLDDAEAIRPGSMAVADTRAKILNAEGKPDEAVKVMDKEVARTGSFRAHLLRGRLLESAGRHDQAEKDYIRLTELQSGSEPLARFYERRGRQDDAVAVLEKGVRANSDDLALQQGLVRMLMRRDSSGDSARALEILSDLDKRFGERPRPGLLFLRAGVLMTQTGGAAMRKAQTLLERVVELEPGHIRAYLGLIDIALRNQHHVQARAIALRGLQAAPNDASLLLAQARAEIALKNDEAASKLARKALRGNASNAEAVGILASIAIRSKKPEALSEALEMARQAVRARPRDHRLPLTAAAILRAMGKPAAAAAELEAYAKTPAGRDSVPVLIALAAAHRQRDNPDASDQWIRRAEKLAPRDSTVLGARLWWLADRKDIDRICSSMTEYSREDRPDPSILTLAASLVAASRSASHLQVAVKLCERAVAVSPNPVNERLALAATVLQTGDLDRAESIYRQVRQADPINARALNGLAWTLATGRKDYKAALPLANKAARLAPNNSHVRDTRGVILSNLPGRLADARKDFEKCVELIAPDSPRRAKALFQLGRTCQQLADHAAARKHLEEALRIDAKNEALTPEQRREIAGLIKGLPAKSGS